MGPVVGLGLFSWIGRGWMVPAVTFGVSLAMELLSEGVTGDDQYYQTHALPLAAAFSISGLVNAASFWSLYKESWLGDDYDSDSSGFTLSERESAPIVASPHPGWFDHSFALINQGVWALILFGAAIWILLSREL